MDLAQHPMWAPLELTLTAGRWHGNVWCEPRLPGEETYDPWLLRPDGAGLRVVVADPAFTSPHVPVAQAMEAATVAAAYAASGTTVADGLERAYQEVFSDPYPWRNPAVAVAAVHVGDDGTVSAALAGDTEVWVRRGHVWSRLGEGDHLTDRARAALTAHPGWGSTDPQQHYEAHRDVLSFRLAWRCPPVGLFAGEAPTLWEASGVDEAVVASDGAQLTAQRCADLRLWLAGGLQRTDDPPRLPSPHGDVTVVRLVRTDPQPDQRADAHVGDVAEEALLRRWRWEHAFGDYSVEAGR